MNYSFEEAHSVLELFGSGRAFYLYEYFGAHKAEQNGIEGVVFRVWAPNALNVSVVGEFNDWNVDVAPMNKIENGCWEVFIQEAKQNDWYKFCITAANNEKIYKTDPFAFYTLPKKDNTSVVYHIDDYKWNDSEYIDSVSACDSIFKPMNIYEIHLGSWQRNADGTCKNYRDIADELAVYLKDMNYTHVQLMPVMEHPFGGSWGYQTTGYFSATSRYGSPEDLMYFVDRLHRDNIGVIVEWVPSNFPKDSFGLYEFDGSHLYESADEKMRERPSWGTCLFDFSKPEVMSFLISSALFWIGKYHFDGLRIGAVSSMLFLDHCKSKDEWTPNKFGGKENIESIDFITRLNSAVHEKFPYALIFAEEDTAWPKLTRPVTEGGLGFDYKWNMGWMNDILHYMLIAPKWRPFNHDNLTFSFFYAFSEHFLLPLSHDVVSNGKGSLINKMPGEYEQKFSGVRALIAYMLAHPGKKLTFMGTEIGQFDEWNSESSIQWNLLSNEKHSQLKKFFKDINSFYLENKPLYELDSSWKGFDWIHHDDYINSVIAFKRTDKDGNDIIAVCNFCASKLENYNIGVPKFGLYDEVFSSDRPEYGGTGVSNGIGMMPIVKKIHSCNQALSLTLPPLGVIYLKCTKPLEMPQQ